MTFLKTDEFARLQTEAKARRVEHFENREREMYEVIAKAVSSGEAQLLGAFEGTMVYVSTKRS